MRKPPKTPPSAPPAATGPTDPSGADRISVPLHSAQSIVSLHVVGTAHDLALPPKNVMRLGRGEVDIRIPHDVDDRTLVSREHVELTRQGSDDGTWLQVVDLGSLYGSFFAAARERDFVVRAGETFRVGSVELLVMDRLLVQLRRELGGFFGPSQHAAIDHHVSLLHAAGPMLLLGDRGSERGHLAKAIHDASRRRGRPFIEVPAPTASRGLLEPVFRAAAHGTVFVSLDQIGPRAKLKSLVELMFDPAHDVTPIITARDHRVICDALSTSMPHFTKVSVPPVTAHRHDLPALVDMLLEELGSPHRVADLDPAAARGLCAYDWPRNRAEVREAAGRIAALLDHDGNMSAAAASRNEDYEHYRRSLAKLGVKARGE